MEMSENNVVYPGSEAGWTPFGVAATFSHPDDVVSDPKLTKSEKRAILASWASDSRAVENDPQLRRLDSGAVVEVAEILRALATLDGPATATKRQPFATRRRGVLSTWLRRKGSANDDDDDPPPAPAGIAVPFRPTFVAAHAALPGEWAPARAAA
jgi:hypothetical protein